MQGVCMYSAIVSVGGLCVCMHLYVLAGTGIYEAHQVPLVILYTSRDVRYYVRGKKSLH